MRERGREELGEDETGEPREEREEDKVNRKRSALEKRSIVVVDVPAPV